MTRRVYTSRFSSPNGTDSRNALATKAAQNGMAQRHHFLKALVVCLMHHYFKKDFYQGKRKTLRSEGFSKC